jgi:hypothetical protein
MNGQPSLICLSSPVLETVPGCFHAAEHPRSAISGLANSLPCPNNEQKLRSDLTGAQPCSNPHGAKRTELLGFADLEDLRSARSTLTGSGRFAIFHGRCLSVFDLALCLTFYAVCFHIQSSLRVDVTPFNGSSENSCIAEPEIAARRADL